VPTNMQTRNRQLTGHNRHSSSNNLWTKEDEVRP